MKSKKKPGPKPKPESEKVVKKGYSFAPDTAAVLDSVPRPGAFLQKLIRQSEEYKKVHGVKK